MLPRTLPGRAIAALVAPLLALLLAAAAAHGARQGEPAPVDPAPETVEPAITYLQVVVRRRSLTVDDRGRVGVPLHCIAPPGKRCRSALQMRTAGAPSVARTVSRRMRVVRPAGRRWTSLLKLAPQMRSRLDGTCRRVNGTLRVWVVQLDGESTHVDTPVKLRRAACRRS